MKLELPIALTLLAAACFVAWSGGITGNGRLAASNSPSRMPDYQVHNNAPTTNDSRKLVEEVANQLEGAGPLVAEVQVSVNMFDQQIQSSGRYYQMGKGTRKSRMEVSFDVADAKATIIQICDGHIYYRYQAIGEESNLEIAYLDKVAAADRALLADAKTWMSTGGLASLLTNLASYFDFQPAARTTQDGSEYTVVKGHWNENRLRQLLYGQVNQNFIQNNIQWTRLPAHIPASIEIYLRRQANGLIFPVAIRFVCRQAEGREGDPDSVTLSFDNIQVLESLPDETFRVDPGSIKISDLTGELIERLEDLNRAVRQAANVGDDFFQR